MYTCTPQNFGPEKHETNHFKGDKNMKLAQ